MTTPTPMTDAVVAAIRKWEADPRLYAHTKPPKSIRDHAVDLEIALASQIEITNNERAQKERLTSDLAAAQEALSEERNISAWLSSDVTRLGQQLQEAQEARERAEALAESNARDAQRWRFMFPTRSGELADSPQARFNQVWRKWDGQSEWGEAVDSAIDAVFAGEPK